MLDAVSFRHHAQPPARAEQNDPATAQKLLPPIPVLCYLRRTFASVVRDVDGEDVRLGQDLPHARWTTWELEMGPQEVF